MKQLFILRGLPGSGKSSCAEWLMGLISYANESPNDPMISAVHLESDQFRLNAEGKYEWTPENNRTAHEQCKLAFYRAVGDGIGLIVVSNTFTQLWEYEHYMAYATAHGYQVTVLHVETPLNDSELAERGVHNVPADTIGRMRSRWEPLSAVRVLPDTI